MVGVTGSVATIKIYSLLEALKSINAEVQIVATKHAGYFMKEPVDVPVFRDEDEWPEDYKLGDLILHIELRKWADCFVIAPLSANTLSILATGGCPNLLTSVFRAWDYSKPVIVAPAMNSHMFNNPPTPRQLACLSNWGVNVIDPISKRLACNDVGIGAMAKVETIVETVALALNVSGNLPTSFPERD